MEPSSAELQPTSSHPMTTNVSPLNILILTFGTRGDVQPYVSITQQLLSHGHRVRLVVPPALEPWIRDEYALETWCHGQDMRPYILWAMQKPRDKALSFIDGGFWKLAEKQVDVFGQHWWASVDGDGNDHSKAKTGENGVRPFVADAIIASPPGMMHVHIAQRLGIPVFLTHFNPKTPTREWPHGDRQPSDKTFVSCDENLQSWQTGDSKVWKLYFKRIVNKARKRHVDLPKLGADFWPAQFNDLGLPVTYLYSQHVLPRPDDFPANHQLAGYTFLEPPAGFKPDRALEDFLSGDGSARTVYVDFGSNEHLEKARLTAEIVAAVKANGAKAIFRRAWYASGTPNPPENVFVTDALPHSWLFPRVDLILHAGGAGVTGMSVRNGVPSALMPFRVDQFLWSKALERLGTAPAAVAMKDMTEGKMTALIKEALGEKYRNAAKEVSEKIRREPDGSVKAVDMFHEHSSAISALPPRCSLLPERQAVWTVRGRPGVKLSALAAHFLDREKACRYGKMDLLKIVDWDGHASLKPWPKGRERKRDVVRERRMAQGVFDAKESDGLREEVLGRWKALQVKNGDANGS